LVVSSILRLYLYVGVYSLSEWRAAAFIWMLLVAIGLVLIMARIALDRPNSWLVWRNAAALAITLYFCGFVDFPAIIANFNVAHSREMSGMGQPIDYDYLYHLGPAAIPAFDALAAKADTKLRFGPAYLSACREQLVARYRSGQDDWLGFTFRGYRLGRYLDRKDATSLAPAGGQLEREQGG
jgi:hypothetical protein